MIAGPKCQCQQCGASAPQFVAMLWRYANLFQHISEAAARRGSPKRALRAAAVAQALEDMARSEEGVAHE